MDNSNDQLQNGVEVQCVTDRNCQCKDEKVAIAHETRSHDSHKTNQQDDKCLSGPPLPSSVPSVTNKDNCRDEINVRKPAKRSRKLNSTSNEQDAANGNIEVRPKKRQWESWGVDDKRIFFEALNEYGKDFDKIQSYIATKHRRRGDSIEWIKNKDQVRHFYYRTWNKISKYLDKNKDIYINGKKINQELCSLICYGELRKKIKGTAEKEVRKLNELITKGSTCVRYRGRNVKIKAPYNQAMKVLTKGDAHTNHSDGSVKYYKMPKKLIVELEPASNFSWTVVQTIAQNPRLRVILPSRNTIGSLIEYLKRKWKSHEDFHETSSCSLDLAIVATKTSNSINSSNDHGTVVSQSNGNCKTDDQKVGFFTGDRQLTPDPLIEDNNEDKVNIDSVLPSNKDVTSPSNNNQSSTENKSEKELETQWNLDNCDVVSIGDVYLQLGRPEKFQLKYVWTEKRKDSDANDSVRNDLSSALKRLAELADAEFTFIKQNNSTTRSVNGSTLHGVIKEVENCKNSTTSSPSSPVYNPSKRIHAVTESSQGQRPFIAPTTSIATQVTTITLPKGRKSKNVATKGRPIVPHRRIILPRISNPPPGAVAVSVFPDMSLTNLQPVVDSGQKTTEPLQLRTVSMPPNSNVSPGNIISTRSVPVNGINEQTANEMVTFGGPSSDTSSVSIGSSLEDDSNKMDGTVKAPENGHTSSILDMAVDKAFSRTLKSSLDSGVNIEINDSLIKQTCVIKPPTDDSCEQPQDMKDSSNSVGDWEFDISLGELLGTDSNLDHDASESKVEDNVQSLNQIKDTHSAMESILNEDSVDYVKKFATMASQMSRRNEDLNSNAHLSFKSVI